MTTDHPVTAARDASVENLFETVFKGYAKRQVEDYIAWLQEQVSAAKSELTDARRELAVARDDLASTRSQLQTRPQHEEISVRMAQILRLAEEDAQQSATQIVEGTRRECDDELAAARAEANRLVETARRQAEATMSDARERARSALADADRRTQQITNLQEQRLSAGLSAPPGAHSPL